MSQIIFSQTVKPQLNLAFEEYLVKNAREETNILFLWQNDETVVIGRNQNPWSECHVENIKKDGINLVRRLTGGGAVFHDLGNLNFTFISKNSDSKIADNFKIINDSLARLNIESRFNGKNDLVAGDKKISGNAFVVEGDMLCHHGCLLVDTDLDRLGDYLNVSDLKLKSKGIESVKSRVCNISSMNCDITVTAVMGQLVEMFSNKFFQDLSLGAYDEKRIQETLSGFENRYETWSWNYGSSPNFEATFEDRFNWGEIQINIDISDGVITGVKIYTDANDPLLAKVIETRLKDLPFDKREILKSIASMENGEGNDVYRMFDDKMF